MQTVTFTLRPLPQFRLDLTVCALRRRPHNTIDRWDGHTYVRVFPFQGRPLKVEAYQKGTPDRPVLRTTVSGKWEVYDTIKKLTGRWDPYAGFVYFHFLLQNLKRQGYL